MKNSEEDRVKTIQAAADWAAALYEERTIAMAQGLGSIDFAHPHYRVTAHEIFQKFGLNFADRADFQLLFDKVMKKRHLLQVLRGKMKSDEWFEKYKKGKVGS